MFPEADTISDEQLGRELEVTFFPALFLQRRIWILDTLRRENVSDVLDIGCGEGQLLSVLTVPSPWLSSPPQSLLYPNGHTPDLASPINLYNTPSDPIPNLHINRLAGLDISSRDLEFAAEAIAPPLGNAENEEDSSIDPWRFRTKDPVRWEEMTAKLWQGGLETINEEFVGTECIVSTEVIEHLPPSILPFFAPILLGVYKPKFLLVTTPSYTFNALFTSPNSHPSIRLRSGYSDPTGRTNRIFRHEDHQFEWTPEEFRKYCEKEAKEWGYAVDVGDVGRAQEADEWGRDKELGGASLVAMFRRIDDNDEVVVDREAIEKKARELVGTLNEEQQSSSLIPQSYLPSPPSTHRLLLTHAHPAHPSAQKPLPFHSIRETVRSRMEDLRESFLRVEDLWYEPEVAHACGGWIELLIAAVDQYDGGKAGLKLTKDAESPEDPLSPHFLHDSPLNLPLSSSPSSSPPPLSPPSPGSSSSSSSPDSDNPAKTPKLRMNIQRERDLWKICLVGAPNHPIPLWPTTEVAVNDDEEGDRIVEYLSSDWNPDKNYVFEYGDVSGYSYGDDEDEKHEDETDDEDHHGLTDNERFDYSETIAEAGSTDNLDAEWSNHDFSKGQEDGDEDTRVNNINYITGEEGDVSWGKSGITPTTAITTEWRTTMTVGNWGKLWTIRAGARDQNRIGDLDE